VSTDSAEQLGAIRNYIATILTAEDREKVETLANTFRFIVKNNHPYAGMAFALVGAELACVAELHG
jgi:hypothetical protein